MPKLTQDEVKNLNIPIYIEEIEFLRNPGETPGPNTFAAEFYQSFKVEIIPILQKIFQKIDVKKILSDSFYEDNITLIPKQNRTLQEYYRPICFVNRDTKSF